MRRDTEEQVVNKPIPEGQGFCFWTQLSLIVTREMLVLPSFDDQIDSFS